MILRVSINCNDSLYDSSNKSEPTTPKDSQSPTSWSDSPSQLQERDDQRHHDTGVRYMFLSSQNLRLVKMLDSNGR